MLLAILEVVNQWLNQIFKEPTTNLKICLEREEKVTLIAPEGYPVYIWNGVRGTSNTFEVTAPGQTILSIEDARGCLRVQLTSLCPDVLVWIFLKLLLPCLQSKWRCFNDTWIVNGLENNADARISVYNRYGILCFQVRAISLYGTENSKTRPTGTYYYKIWDVNNSKAIKGSITLIK
ncbi:T9SS type B sorting domain-containing protein [Pedobacter sp. PWIIR3]